MRIFKPEHTPYVSMLRKDLIKMKVNYFLAGAGSVIWIIIGISLWMVQK